METFWHKVFTHPILSAAAPNKIKYIKYVIILAQINLLKDHFL